MNKRKTIIKVLLIILLIIIFISFAAFITFVLPKYERVPEIITNFKTNKINVKKEENSVDDKSQSDEKKLEVTDKNTSENNNKKETQSKTEWEEVAKILEQVADTTAKEKEKEEQARIEAENATPEETDEDDYFEPEESNQTIPTVSWGWPSDSSYITTYYGYDDWHGGFHNGIDISLSGCYSPIYAIEEGTVLETNSGCADISSGYGDYCGSGYGNYVWIEHPENVYALYSQLSSQILVYPGQSVLKGQVIGYMGSSGSSSACHLHFSTFRGGTQYGTYGGGTSFDPLELYP